MDLDTHIPSAETLRKARRNQQFDNRPATSMALCPLKAREFAIYPVRYAVDASPAKGSALGPNPLPQGWRHSHLPPLRTRSYTLRQLREGWLYVWDHTAQALHEYQSHDYRFTRHIWGEAQEGKDTRHNPGATHPYLLYPRHHRLSIAFSPVQWTWRLCERVRAGEAHRWARDLDLAQYSRSMEIPHGAPLRELGGSVADILVQNQPSPAFDTCFTTTEPAEDDPRECKPAFEEALVRGTVPDQDSALFIVLEDPMAILDDLCMNLHGRRLEIEAHDTEHRNKTHTAALVHRLCGVDLEPFIPLHIRQDPVSTLAFTHEAHAMLERESMARAMNSESDTLLMRQAASHARHAFQAAWNTPPLDRRWDALVEQWHGTRTWRNDVRYDEAWTYLFEQSKAQERLNGHAQRAEQDLLSGLEHLGDTVEDTGYDPCQPKHAATLLDTLAEVYVALGASETGHAWLCHQYQEPTTLAGQALFNFNGELMALVERLSENFSRYGTLDAQGQQSEGSGQLFGGISDTTNVASRINEVNAVLDLPAVQRSALYKNASKTVHGALATLRQVAAEQARHNWLTVSQILLAALDGKRLSSARMLAYSVVQVLAGPELSERPQLIRNTNYSADLQAWQKRLKALQQQIDGVRAVLSRRGPNHDRHAARIQLANLQRQQQALLLQQPIAIHGSVVGDYAVSLADTEKRNHWLRYLGQDEAYEQLRLKAHNAAAHAARAKQWVDQNMGGTLPLLVAGLNLWNLLNSLENARKDGILTPDELRAIGANGAYTLNATMALWVAPAWNRWAGLAGVIRDRSFKLTEVSLRAWINSEEKVVAKLAGKLLVRTMGMAAFGAIAAGVEAWQVGLDRKNATGLDEEQALDIKAYSLGVMAATFTIQAIGAALGVWITFTWIMSTPVVIFFAIIGVVYLMSSLAANYFKRDGLRLWLYRCSWGRNAKWTSSDEDHSAELHALHRISLTPSIRTLGVVFPRYLGDVPEYSGFWLQVLIPGELQGQSVQVRAIATERHDRQRLKPQTLTSLFHNYFLKGYWAPLDRFENFPIIGTNTRQLPEDTHYSDGYLPRLWQTFIPYDRMTAFDIEICFSAQGLEPMSGHRYLLHVKTPPSIREGVIKDATAEATAVNAQRYVDENDLPPLELIIP